mgnify:CR=1 FL=1
MHPRCSRGLVVDDMEEMVTSEEVKPGVFPDWLFDQMVSQCRDPRPHSLGGPARILVIYPTEESRREWLERLADQNLVIDRTLHHTIDSLEFSLLEDLRLPRVLSTSGAFFVVLNEACAQAARQLEFPILNPIESLEWNSNRTNELAQLHSLLAEEDRLNEFQGPGIEAFTRVLQDLEQKLGGTHPDFVTSKVVKALRISEDTPFSVSDIDGIIMLDHAPVISRSKHNLLRAISLHRPIHQLEYPGNFRLGYHGEQIFDQPLIKTQKDLPQWVPDHKPFRADEENESSRIENRLRVQRESHTIPTVINLLEDKFSSNPDARILIVDPSLSDTQYRWKRSLSNLAIHFSTGDVMLSSRPLGHWISAAAKISHGPNSFALDDLRSLSIQKSITLFEEPAKHPSDSRIVPKADSDILTSIARNEHILAGPGSLSRWLESLRRKPTNPHINPESKESSQWFLLCLAYSNRPLLDPHDRIVIDDDEMWLGCHSGEILPRPDVAITGDKWLESIVKRANIDHTGFDSYSPLPAAVIQTLVETHKRLRMIQNTSGYEPAKEGSSWVDEFQTLISSTPILGARNNIRNNVRLLTPKDAHGCTADIVIIAHVSSLSWDLSLPRYAFLGDEDRHELDILRPDTPIRQARHYFYHIQSSCQELFVIDPSLDNATPVSAVIREWINSVDPENKAEEFHSSSHTSSDPRLNRRKDGEKLVDMQFPSRPPLNPTAVSIPLDVLIQRDIERRRPEEIDDEGYIPEDSKFIITGLLKDELLRKIINSKPDPRSAKKWPVIGGYVSSNRATPTIDPRPFIPFATKSQSFDSRNGRCKEAKQEFQTWSPSRIKEWQICPRRGWLKYGLKAKEDELQEEDIDPRTHGDLLHNVHHGLLSEILGMDEGIERTLSDIRSGKNPLNISHSEKTDNELQAIALAELAHLAPWLDRTDAVSTSRLRMLTGMNRVQWNKWLIDQSPSIPAGRVGTIVKAERLLKHSIPIAYEWKAKDYDKKGILISIPEEISSISNIKPIRLVGDIDRVDLLPFSDDPNDLLDESGDKSVAPLRIIGTTWKPRRLVVIRDLKTTESKSGEDRHAIGILDEVQVALYARAWEESHPGDLVVAAGISAIGHETDHILEISRHAPQNYTFEVGKESDLTNTRFRFPDEDSDTHSDPFRAWLTHRLSTALGIAANAAQGSVNPTPSKEGCRWCSVKSLCPVGFEEAYS